MAVRNLQGLSKVLLRTLTVLSPLCFLCGVNVSADEKVKPADIWDDYGLSGYVAYDQECKSTITDTINTCKIAILVTREQTLFDSFLFWGINDYLALIPFINIQKPNRNIVFKFLTEGIPSADGLQKYSINVNFGIGTSLNTKRRMDFIVKLDTASMPRALRENMLLTYLSLVTHPAHQQYFRLMASSSFYASVFDSGIIDFSPTTLNQKGSMENSVQVDSGGSFAHEFEFDPISKELERVVVFKHKDRDTAQDEL